MTDQAPPTSAGEEDTATAVAPAVVVRPKMGRPRGTRYDVFKGLDDEEQLGVYLEVLKTTGAYIVAAQSIECNANEIATYRRDNPEFKSLSDDALGLYGQSIVEAARQRALHGTQEPMLGGRERDQIIAYRTNHSDALMAMFLKRVDPEFRDKTEVKVETSVAPTFDYSKCSQRVRDLLRLVATYQKEDEERRARGEVVE